jgi:hypothetical protein
MDCSIYRIRIIVVIIIITGWLGLISLSILFPASVPPCFLTALLAERSLLVTFSSRLEVPYVASWGNA